MSADEFEIPSGAPKPDAFMLTTTALLAIVAAPIYAMMLRKNEESDVPSYVLPDIEAVCEAERLIEVATAVVEKRPVPPR